MITKKELKGLLSMATGCEIQNNGWCCGTCFSSISEKLNNKDWQTVLLTRGYYKKEELDNLPKDTQKRLERIKKIILAKI